MSFVKLDTKVLDSTLWFDKPARDVFLTALLMAIPREFESPLQQIQVDKIEPTGFVAPPGWYGYVTASGPGIVHRAIVDPSEGIEALRRLGNPDDATGSQAFEGRRMIRIDGGYAILNYMRYREFDHSAAERMRRLRERRKALRRNNRNVRANVTHSREQIADAEINSKTSSSELKSSSDAEMLSRARIQIQSSQEACRLAQLLKREILQNKPDYRITPAQERSWAQIADRMIRLDHRDPDRIAELIRWAQRDEFWRSNILSMDKLREKFDALELKAGGSKIKMAPAEPVSAAEQLRKSLGVAAVEADYNLPTNLDRDAGEEIWRSALGKLAARISPHSFDTWLRPCKAAGVRDQTLYLKLPTVNFSHVGNKYVRELAEVLPGLKVEFLIPQAVLEVGRGAAAD